MRALTEGRAQQRSIESWKRLYLDGLQLDGSILLLGVARDVNGQQCLRDRADRVLRELFAGNHALQCLLQLSRDVVLLQIRRHDCHRVRRPLHHCDLWCRACSARGVACACVERGAAVFSR